MKSAYTSARETGRWLQIRGALPQWFITRQPRETFLIREETTLILDRVQQISSHQVPTAVWQVTIPAQSHAWVLTDYSFFIADVNIHRLASNSLKPDHGYVGQIRFFPPLPPKVYPPDGYRAYSVVIRSYGRLF
jgi:hypothetical protein